MSTDFRALCAELLAWADVTAAHYVQLPDVMIRARAALAEPVAEPPAVAERPSDEELRDLWIWAAGQDQGPWPTQYHCFARAVLARWGQPLTPPADRHAAPVPVPVSERLPRPEDCDAEGRCWVGHWCYCAGQTVFSWELDRPSDLTWKGIYEMAGWLPAHALPLLAPQGGEVTP